MHPQKLKRPLLSFHAVLGAQLDGTLNYVTLKRLLRALRSSKNTYPTLHDCHSVQPLYSQSSQPHLTLSNSNQPPNRRSEEPLVYDNEYQDTLGSFPGVNETLQAKLVADGQENAVNLYENPREVMVSQIHDHPGLSVSSRLRRKRRHSRRPLAHQLRDLSVQLFAPNNQSDELRLSQSLLKSNHNSTENEGSSDVNVTHYPRPSERKTAQTNIDIICGDDKSAEFMDGKSFARKPCASECAHTQTGVEVNKILEKLTISCVQGDFVRWHQLRKVLTRRKKFQRFCKFVDTLFDADELLASGPSTTSGRDSNPCVYYSDFFWERAWRDSTV